MLCRSCGTEIAEKAIICYRCGAGTSDPVRKAVPIPPKGSGWPSLVGAAAPLPIAATLALLADTSGHPHEMTTGAEGLAALGVVLLVARAIRRR
jgi:hypothetical protein